MKKLIIICTLALSVSFADAQLAIGPVLGVGHSYFKHSNDNDVENSFHLHYNGGIKLLYAFPGSLGVSTSLKFSREGDTYEYVSSGDNIKAEVDANYLRIPIMLHYYFGDASKTVRPEIALGPSFGILVGGEQETYVNGDLDFTMKTDKIMESSDIGLQAAVGLNFKVGTSAVISTTVNYYHGFKDVYKIESPEVMNRNIGLNVGVLFPLGGGSTRTTTTTTN